MYVTLDNQRNLLFHNFDRNQYGNCMVFSDIS